MPHQDDDPSDTTMSTETDLIDTKGITSVLGLTSVEYVRNRVVTRPDFPAPAINFSARSRKWRRAEVAHWAQQRHAQPASRRGHADDGPSFVLPAVHGVTPRVSVAPHAGTSSTTDNPSFERSI